MVCIATAVLIQVLKRGAQPTCAFDLEFINSIYCI